MRHFRKLLLVNGFLLTNAVTLSTGANLSAADEIAVKDCRTTFVNRATLSTERVGVIAEVAREGDRVEKGEIVIRLRDDVPRANLKIAQARAENETQILVAQKAALAAAAEHDAAVEANQISSVSNPAFPPTHMTRLRLNAEAALLEIDSAKHERRLNELLQEQAQAELQSYWVVSKMDGHVTRVFKREGEGIQQSESIIQVVNTDSMRIEGYVRVADSTLVEKGMPVRVTFSLPRNGGEPELATETGTLGFVDVSVQTLSGVVRVWAEIDNRSGRYREGIPATMTIIPEGEKEPNLKRNSTP